MFHENISIGKSLLTRVAGIDAVWIDQHWKVNAVTWENQSHHSTDEAKPAKVNSDYPKNAFTKLAKQCRLETIDTPLLS